MQGNEPEVVLALFPLLPVLLGAAASGLSAYGKYKSAQANKPFEQKAIKQRAFKQRANTGYLKRYMADLRGRSASRARTELAMRPALRAIGAQQQKGQRMLAYQSAQQGLAGSGIEAQKQLSLQAGTTQAVGGLGEKVLLQQLAQARQMQAQKEGQRMKLAGEIGRQESAVAEANRRSQFQTGEANRMAEERVQQSNLAAQQQYQQSVSAAKGNILTSAIGGGLSAGMPYAQELYKAKLLTPGAAPHSQQALTSAETAGTQYDVSGNPMSVETNDLLAEEQQVDQWGNPISYGKKGGRVTKEGIAQYQYGGDVRAAVPEIVKKEEELYKQYQTELEPKLAEHEKQLQIEADRKKQFEIDKATEQKRIEEANLLAQQKHAEQKKLFETGEGRRDVLDYQKRTTKRLKKKGIIGEGGERIYGTKGLKGENVEGALQYLKTNPEEYNVLKEKADVLQKYSLGEKQLTEARKKYDEQLALHAKYPNWSQLKESKGDSFEDFLEKVTNRPNYDAEELFGKNLSKREKKKLSKKYDKKTLALLQSKGGFGAVDPSFDPESLQGEMTPDEYAQLVKERQTGEKFGEALETRDPGEFKPQELVQEEYKPQYTAEAPTLQAPTEKELQKIQTREIYKQLVGGIDVAGNIAKAKTNREATDFFKQFSGGNMTMEQMWSHPWAAENPKQIATMISTRQTAKQKLVKAEEKQFADREKVRDNITQRLFDIGSITASGEPITADDPDTALDESTIATSGERIRDMVEANPDGVTPDVMKNILLYVDKIKEEYGDEGGSSTEVDWGDGSVEAMMAGLTSMSDQSGSGKVTRLLKELLKLPIIAQEGMLAEEIENVPKTEPKQTKQVSGFQFK
jgi:hypothetical protein